jgi:putative ABC transport system permease protein
MNTLQATREACKSLGANKLRAFLMMLGPLIGIATLTVIVAVGQGARRQVLGRMGKMWATNPIMVTAGGGQFGGERSMAVGQAPATLTEADRQAIAQEVPNVAKASPGLVKPDAPVKYHEQSITTTVFGVTPDFHRYRSWDVENGEPMTEEDVSAAARACWLGHTVAQTLFGDADPVGQTVRIENVGFKVRGVLVAKGTNPMGGDFDDRILIPVTTFARRLYHVDYLSNIVIELEDLRRMDQTAAAITALLRERHHITAGLPDDFGVRTPSGLTARFTGASRTLTLFLSLVSAIALLVGGLVVMNIMLIAVSERTREIGLRRAVGARRKDILCQFLLEALAVTVLGGLLGVLVGILVAQGIAAFGRMPTAISWPAVGLAVIFSALIGLVFGLQPARRAAGLNPVEALRSE